MTVRQAAAKPRTAPAFIDRRELAEHLRCSTATVTARVAKGEVPPPWTYGGRTAPLWRRDHFEAFVESRTWPAEAWGDR